MLFFGDSPVLPLNRKGNSDYLYSTALPVSEEAHHPWGRCRHQLPLYRGLQACSHMAGEGKLGSHHSLTEVHSRRAGEGLRSLPDVAQKEPGGQGVGSGLPLGQKEPAGHFPPVAVAGHRQLALV